MKRIATVALVACMGLAFLAAQPGPGWGMMGGPGGPMMGQGYGPGPWGGNQANPPKPITIEGKLVFIDGYPAVQAKDKTYFFRMPGFYEHAYTDKIAEGAQVKAEGYELPSLPGQDKPFFAAAKATINGKTYDSATARDGAWGRGRGGRGYGPGMMMGRGAGPGMMGGPGRHGFFGRDGGPESAVQAKSIEGKLVFVQGYPAVQAKDKTYIIRMPAFYKYAYTDKIAEGAQVKADGYELPALPGQDKPYFAVTKASIAGKVYDFTLPGKAGAGMRMRGMMGGW